MSGFQSPNFTQTPNDFFAMVPDMSDAELRVTTVMIRLTFGYHRDGFKMGVSKLATAAGLSRQGALDGAEAAENRGTFRRTNAGEQGEAEWELIVSDPLQPVDTPSSQLIPPLNPVEGGPLASRGQVGVKESKKKELKKGDLVDGMIHFGQIAIERGEDKVEAVICNLEREFSANFQRTPKIQSIARFILSQEEKGESLMRFVVWAKRDEFNASRLYEYAEQPEKIRTRWPQAFVRKTGEGSPDDQPEPKRIDTPFTQAIDNWEPYERKTWAQIQAERKQSEPLNNHDTAD